MDCRLLILFWRKPSSSSFFFHIFMYFLYNSSITLQSSYFLSIVLLTLTFATKKMSQYQEGTLRAGISVAATVFQVGTLSRKSFHFITLAPTSTFFPHRGDFRVYFLPSFSFLEVPTYDTTTTTTTNF